MPPWTMPLALRCTSDVSKANSRRPSRMRIWAVPRSLMKLLVGLHGCQSSGLLSMESLSLEAGSALLRERTFPLLIIFAVETGAQPTFCLLPMFGTGGFRHVDGIFCRRNGQRRIGGDGPCQRHGFLFELLRRYQ